jgi:hypothetical protein
MSMINDSMEKGCKAVVEQTPDLVQLLQVLQKEIEENYLYANRIERSVDNVKRFGDKKESTPDPTKEPSGFVEYIWAEIWKLRKCNEVLKNTSDHLSTIIGI